MTKIAKKKKYIIKEENAEPNFKWVCGYCDRKNITYGYLEKVEEIGCSYCHTKHEIKHHFSSGNGGGMKTSGGIKPMDFS